MTVVILYLKVQAVTMVVLNPMLIQSMKTKKKKDYRITPYNFDKIFLMNMDSIPFHFTSVYLEGTLSTSSYEWVNKNDVFISNGSNG